MAALLVKRLLWRISQTLTDTAPQFARYTERDMVIAVQAGVKALCKYLPTAGTRSIAMKLAAGSRQSIAKIIPANAKNYDGSTLDENICGIQLIELLRNMGPDGLTPGRSISIVDRQRMDGIDPLWHTKTGSTVCQYAYNPQDPLTFFVIPAVPSSGPAVWVDLVLCAPPKPIEDGGEPGTEKFAFSGSSTAIVGIDDQYEDELWNYAVAYLLLSNAKSANAITRASVHVQAFNGSINSLAAQLTGHNPNLKTLPFAPDVAGAAS